MRNNHFGQDAAGYLTAHRTRPTSFKLRFQSSLAGWYHSWQKRRQYQRDMKHVAQFDDHLLRDIGLTADDIAEIGRLHRAESADWVGRRG